MKNSILAYSLLTLGILTGTYGIQQLKPSEVQAEVIPAYDSSKAIPLTIYGTQDLPDIERGRVAVKSVKTGNTSLPLFIGALGLLSAGVAIFERGTSVYKRDYPQYVQDTIDASLAAQRRKAAAEASAQIALEDQRRAFQGEAPPLTEQQQKERDHLLALIEIQQQQELLAEQLKLAKIKADIEALSNSSGGKKADPKKALRKMLKDHEGGWLDQITSGNKPLILIGAMGSGKTTLAHTLLLIRKLLHGCDPTMVFDTHGHKNRVHHWDNLLKFNPDIRLIGFDENGQNWNQYLEEFYKLPKLFDAVIPEKGDASNLAKTASFIDEATLARTESETRGDGDQYWRAFMDVFTGSRKGQHAVTFGLHNLTKTTVPDGVYNMVREGATIVTLRTDLANKPTFTGTLGYRGAEGEVETPITIPKWLNPETIYEMFGI